MSFGAISAFTRVFDALWRLNPPYDVRSLALPPRNAYFVHMSIPMSKHLLLPLAFLLVLATAQTAAARVKKHRVERPAPPAVTLEHGTPIIMQGLTWPKSPAPAEIQPQQRAERPRAIPRGSSVYVAPAPLPAPRLSQPSAIGPYQPPAINSLSDKVTGCIQSFPFNAGLGNNPTNRDFYIRSCVNN